MINAVESSPIRALVEHIAIQLVPTDGDQSTRARVISALIENPDQIWITGIQTGHGNGSTHEVLITLQSLGINKKSLFVPSNLYTFDNAL